MFRSYLLGRPLGVELRVHGTVFLLLGLLSFLSLLTSGFLGALTTLLLVSTVLLCVTLHELGHIGAARLFGIGTTGITLYPFGGVARLTREARTPTEEVVVALAGPAVNLLLAGMLALPVAFFGWFEPLTTLLLVNVVLLVFNLIPAFPMDGGRVLRGLLWPRLGHRKATRWAARAGQGFALVFGVLGLLGNPMLLVIAAFVFMHATAELGRLNVTGYGAPYHSSGSWVAQPQPAPAPRVVQVRTPWGTLIAWELEPGAGR